MTTKGAEHVRHGLLTFVGPGADSTHCSVLPEAPFGRGKEAWLAVVQSPVHCTSAGIGGTPINAVWKRSKAFTTH